MAAPLSPCEPGLLPTRWVTNEIKTTNAQRETVAIAPFHSLVVAPTYKAYAATATLKSLTSSFITLTFFIEKGQSMDSALV